MLGTDRVENRPRTLWVAYCWSDSSQGIDVERDRPRSFPYDVIRGQDRRDTGEVSRYTVARFDGECEKDPSDESSGDGRGDHVGWNIQLITKMSPQFKIIVISSGCG